MAQGVDYARLREMLDVLQSGVFYIEQRSLSELIKSVVMYLDAARIEDPSLNLLINAIESIDGNGCVTVRLLSDDEEALIEIYETGSGTQDQPRTFELALPLKRQQHRIARSSNSREERAGKAKRGRPQRQTASSLGKLIIKTMKLLGFSYKDVVSKSERLARLNNNPDMRIGKSTLGDIVSGSIRQPGTAKLDSLRIILNLSRVDIDAAIGLQPQRRFAEQLQMSGARTHEVPFDAVTRNRKIRLPILHDDADLEQTQFFEGSLNGWTNVEVEYLSSFYPPHLCYVVIGEEDANASPIAPPGSRVLVNKLLNKVQPSDNVSFHKRELFYVMTPNGLTCVYAELTGADKIVLIPHPASGNMREEFNRDDVTIIGQVVGVLYPRQ